MSYESLYLLQWKEFKIQGIVFVILKGHIGIKGSQIDQMTSFHVVHWTIRSLQMETLSVMFQKW